MQKHLRIRVLLFAYAYEIMNDNLVSDSVYDKLCLRIDTTQSTDKPYLDDWFRTEFTPYTGQWIHYFPELHNIAALYKSCQRGKK